MKNIVIPAKAGIQRCASAQQESNDDSNGNANRFMCSLSLALDSGFRRNDEKC
jgi:hypothetical protein